MIERRMNEMTEELERKMNTYAWGWNRWWLEESNFDVLCVCLDTTSCWTTNDLWVGIFEETLSIGGIGLNSGLR